MKPFLIVYSLFVLLSSVLLMAYPKEELFFLLNGLNSDFGDAVFPYITHLGGGGLAAIVAFVLAFVKYRWAIIAAITFLLTGFVTMILKLFVFETSLRPSKYFEGSDLVHYVAGVDLHSYNSFPSGHSATVFCTCFFLALILKGKYQAWGIALVALAILVGYSRIYLGQHFPADVLAGSLIGVGLTYPCFKILDERLSGTTWSDKALLKKG